MPSKLPSNHGVHPQRKSHLFRHFVISQEKDLGTASPKLGRMTVLGSGWRSQKQERVLDERHENMLYKIPAVASELSVSISTVNRLISKRQLQTIQIGRSVRISEDQLNQFISISEVKR